MSQRCWLEGRTACAWSPGAGVNGAARRHGRTQSERRGEPPGRRKRDQVDAGLEPVVLHTAYEPNRVLALAALDGDEATAWHEGAGPRTIRKRRAARARVKSSRTLTRFFVFSLRASSFRAPSTARGLALRSVGGMPPAEGAAGEPLITTTEPPTGAGWPPVAGCPALEAAADRTAEGGLEAFEGVAGVLGTLGELGAAVGTDGRPGAGGGAGRGAGRVGAGGGAGTVGVRGRAGGAGTGMGDVGGGGSGTVGVGGTGTVGGGGSGGTGGGTGTVGVGGTGAGTVGVGGTGTGQARSASAAQSAGAEPARYRPGRTRSQPQSLRSRRSRRAVFRAIS